MHMIRGNGVWIVRAEAEISRIPRIPDGVTCLLSRDLGVFSLDPFHLHTTDKRVLNAKRVFN